MFSIDSLVDHSATTAKQAFAYIPNQEVRTGFETLVDANANFTKVVWTAGTSFSKTIYDAALTVMPKQSTNSKK